MEPRFATTASLAVLLLAACAIAPRAQPPPVTPLTPLFGPVIANQVIRGRESGADDELLLVDRTIVHVDLRERRSWSTPIQLDAGATCWGLARLTDGSLWTLKGRNAVIRLEADGRVSQVMQLAEPHAGLFAVSDRLVYQRAVSTAGEPLLRAARPGAELTAWGELHGRSFPGFDRAQAAALNLVACGRSVVAERPCWFPDEAAVFVIAPDGHTRRMPLAGLTTVAPEVLLTAENPRRPVRDAYIDYRRRVWVLSSGDRAAEANDRPGGWLLARYAPDGTPDGQVRLAEPARLILRVDAARVIVLAGSGQVSEIASW